MNSNLFDNLNFQLIIRIQLLLDLTEHIEHLEMLQPIIDIMFLSLLRENIQRSQLRWFRRLEGQYQI